ncbi:hypothetical protein, partial [Holdemania sp. 1001302B_160321_E10]|uniref:hypothetical protein n=1 Tax=Holdemania sp. 1001302B_160321_E10 TaxID=2787120 RepID=UPI001E599F20
SPISGTHLRLSCFGFSLTNTIFERAKIFPTKIAVVQGIVVYSSAECPCQTLKKVKARSN